MSKHRHPSELNPLQRFLQAREALRTTSRAFNDAWYREALDLDLQLHLKIDGGAVRSWIFHATDNRWEAGPEIPDEALTDSEQAAAFIEELFKSTVPRKAPGFGVILHIADEIAIAEINPEHDDPSTLGELRQLIATEPARVISDTSLSPEDQVWRLIPFSSPHSGSFATAVTLSRRYESFLDALREAGEKRNIPVRTAALSAPVAMLEALPFLVEDELTHPLVAVLHYPVFTAMAFFSTEGNLLLLRTLQHRGQQRPNNIRQVASTTAAALELYKPRILVLPFTDNPATSILEELSQVFSPQSVQLIDWESTRFAPSSTGISHPEPVVSSTNTSEAGTPLSNSLTFSAFRDDGWGRQDFLPPSATSVERFPNRKEMRLLRIARFAHLGFAAAATLIIAWMVFSIIGIVRHPEWAFNPDEAKALKQRLLGLGVEQERIHHWDNLLEDRSKGWASMELISRLFPAGSGIMLNNFNHGVRPDTAPGQTKVGFVKEWKISGFSREEGYQLLTVLSTQEGISELFSEVAEITGHEAFATALPSRSLVVNLRTLENSRFTPRPVEELVDGDESTYPLSFDLTITQRFESTDPMAIMVTKAPKL